MHSYDPNLTTPKDEIRFLIGDTGEQAWQLQDPEIDAMLRLNNNSVYPAAIAACRSLVSKYTRLSGNASVGPFSVDYASMASGYRDLIEELNAARMAVSPPAPYASGYKIAAKQAQEDDMSIQPPHVQVGIMDADVSLDTTDGYYR